MSAHINNMTVALSTVMWGIVSWCVCVWPWGSTDLSPTGSLWCHWRNIQTHPK